ncbi:hypothetical protein A5646_03300 [Mycobacterium sp. 1245499.0]|nr:hypothetical protein A5646_03300 [Mycobacterium sp. 1245499.0]
MSFADELRAAAETLVKLSGRDYPNPACAPWSAEELRTEAEVIEAEERETAEREALVTELAEQLFAVSYPAGTISYDCNLRVIYQDRARTLIECGWRKGDSL